MALVGSLVCLYTIKNVEWAGNSFQQSCSSFLELFCLVEIPFLSLPRQPTPFLQGHAGAIIHNPVTEGKYAELQMHFLMMLHC